MTGQTGKGQHTPGPWRWDDEDHRGAWMWCKLVGPNGEGIVIGQDAPLQPPHQLRAYEAATRSEETAKLQPVHVSIPNARLIAAAPALLEALRNAETFLDEWAQGPAEVVKGRRYYPLPLRMASRPANLLAEARTAIRLAEGDISEEAV